MGWIVIGVGIVVVIGLGVWIWKVVRRVGGWW